MHKAPSLLAVTAAAAAFAAVTAAMPSSAAPGPAKAQDNSVTSTTNAGLRAVGLTANGRLVRFPVADPRDTNVIGFVSGLKGDSRLIGIDFRVQNGLLYGVGDKGGVYTLNRSTAKATRVSQLTVALQGKQFGVDFNPAADRLRVVSDTGQNLRHDVNPGGITTVDLTLNYPPDVPVATGVTMAAYTNNDLDVGSGTTLFVIDTNRDQVAIQAPANNGSLNQTGTLGVDVRIRGGFDIYSELDDSGRTKALKAFATLRVGQPSHRLYSVKPLTGGIVDRGAFRGGIAVIDLALPLDQG